MKFYNFENNAMVISVVAIIASLGLMAFNATWILVAYMVVVMPVIVASIIMLSTKKGRTFLSLIDSHKSLVQYEIATAFNRAPFWITAIAGFIMGYIGSASSPTIGALYVSTFIITRVYAWQTKGVRMDLAVDCDNVDDWIKRRKIANEMAVDFVRNCGASEDTITKFRLRSIKRLENRTMMEKQFKLGQLAEE